MTLKVYMGTAAEISARLAGAPNTTTTTVQSATSKSVFVLTSASTFAIGQSIVIERQKAIIQNLVGSTVTLSQDLEAIPTIGSIIRHYDADYTEYRNDTTAFSIINDDKTGGGTGNIIGQDLIINDYKSMLAKPVIGNSVTIFDSLDVDNPLFAGKITYSKRVRSGYKGPLTNKQVIDTYIIRALGYQNDADDVGIEEDPQFNVNAGKFLRYLMEKYTTLQEGEIDDMTSPTLDVVRLANYRRFSDVGQELSAKWPDSEFYIDNEHTVGKVYFRKRVEEDAPITLSETFVDAKTAEQVEIIKDDSKRYNLVRLPFYNEQYREPDFFIQDIVSDNAFLKTNVLLNGEPSNLEETDLILSDFSSADLQADFIQDDRTNPSPPTGHIGSEGFIITGQINNVTGMHLLDASALSPAPKIGDIAVQTDPTVYAPFTGKENQRVSVREVVINALGEAVIGGIIDQSTYSSTVLTGSTVSRIYLSSTANFFVNDRISIGSESPYITAVTSDYIDVSPNITAPTTGAIVSLHRAAYSRIKFGIVFKSTGDLKYIRDGVEYAFSTPRTYTAVTTYSFRWFMVAYETTFLGGVSQSGGNLSDASRFVSGNIVDIFTQGSRNLPERRKVTVAGTNISYDGTDFMPQNGYRVRTCPKIVLQVKGGAFSSITGRDWITLFEDTATWQNSATVERPETGILVALQKSLAATITAVQMKDPPSITAQVGTRILHIGTQDVDTAEPDIDCIVQKIDSRTQLSFFSDSKQFWPSATRLEVRYKEKFEFHMIETDLPSMRVRAKDRGFTLTGTESEDELIRLGGKALDTIQILPNVLTIQEASEQSRAILDAVKDLALSVTIRTNTLLDKVCFPGQTLRSQIPEVPDLVINRVELVEIPGGNNSGVAYPADSGKQLFYMNIQAGTIDRLNDILLKRELKNGNRVVIDDGTRDDTFTKLNKINIYEVATTADSFSISNCRDQWRVIYNSLHYTEIRCLRISDDTPPAPPSGFNYGPRFNDARNTLWIGLMA